MTSPGLEAKAAVKTTLGMKNNCYINVQVFFENVRVRIQSYPPFPTTRYHPKPSSRLVEYLLCMLISLYYIQPIIIGRQLTGNKNFVGVQH